MKVFQCAIEKVAEWHPNLFLESHIAACVAVLGKHSTPPVALDVECTNIVSAWLNQETDFGLKISWSEATAKKAERLQATMQTKQLVELAAVTIALILTHQVVNLGQLDVTDYGERADYRSLDTPSVLEISGTEALSRLAQRHREKTKQALENPFRLDAYVVVCGFSKDEHQVRLSFHRQEHHQDE